MIIIYVTVTTWTEQITSIFYLLTTALSVPVVPVQRQQIISHSHHMFPAFNSNMCAHMKNIIVKLVRTVYDSLTGIVSELQ